MKRIGRYLALMGLSGLMACNSASPTPSTDGFAELVAGAGTGGAVSGSLSFELEGAVTANFKAARVSGAGLDYISSGFKLKTTKGGSLKAMGIIYPPTGVALSAKGDLDIQGILVDLGQYKAIHGVATLRIPSGGATITARAALLMVGDGVQFDEADALFFGELRLLKPSVVNLTNGSLFSYSATNEGGSNTVGIGLADIRQKPGLLERQTSLGYVAEAMQTPYGRAKRLTGAIDSEKSSLIDVLVLGVLLEQPKPQKSLVVACANCTGDVAIAVSEKSFGEMDGVWPSLPKRAPIPLWVTGRDSIPLSKAPTCSELTAVLDTAILAANRYSRYTTFLGDGADVVLVNQTLARHKAGSAKHGEMQQLYAKFRALSWGTARTLASQITALKCYAK